MVLALPALSAFKTGCVLMSNWNVLLRCFFLTTCVPQKPWGGWVSPRAGLPGTVLSTSVDGTCSDLYLLSLDNSSGGSYKRRTSAKIRTEP